MANENLPSSQLAPAICRRGACPAVVALVDQFGVAHGAHARGRAFLAEFGHGACVVLCHDAAGRLHTPAVAELVPDPPAFEFAAARYY